MSKIRTKPVRGLIIFALIASLVSIGAIVLFAIDRSNLFISILVFIFGGLFAMGGLLIVFDQLFHYVELKEDLLINHVFFIKKVLEINKINRITLKQGMYEVYTKKARFCTIPSRLNGADKIIIGLSRRGVNVEEKN